MLTERFNNIVEDQLNTCRDILIKKAEEYADGDNRLHNFVVAADLQRCSMEEALGGFMSKHTVSIYDMLRGVTVGRTYPKELWSEKITDHINYLLLLKAVVYETNDFETPVLPSVVANIPPFADFDHDEQHYIEGTLFDDQYSILQNISPHSFPLLSDDKYISGLRTKALNDYKRLNVIFEAKEELSTKFRNVDDILKKYVAIIENTWDSFSEKFSKDNKYYIDTDYIFQANKDLSEEFIRTYYLEEDSLNDQSETISTDDGEASDEE